MNDNIYAAGVAVLRKNALLVVLFAGALGLSAGLGQPPWRLTGLVDWDTIITLSGLLLITTGIKESGLFYLVAYRISRRIDNERLLALFLIFVSALLATFLTNDIALFIIVPLTLCLQRISVRDYSKTIVFEAIAVNVGSSLTAIGNPQNIFLWHQWGISFLGFIREMVPMVLILTAWLFVAVFFSFPARRIKLVNHQHPVVDRQLFYISAALLAAFIASIEWRTQGYFLLIILAILAIIRTKIIVKTDWGLVLLFIVVFIDLNLICQIKAMQQLLNVLDFNSSHALFLVGAGLSQAISNVPSAILLADYTVDFRMIAYGVNIGGNGLVIGSFANLIALHFIKARGKYLLFHIYSVPYFIVTLFSSYWLLV
jgi:Na+/H+ antiporter NhaD/arsenite permease-like protein